MPLSDLRYAFRTLRKAPLFTAAAVATLALGIGVNASMFSVLDAELIRPLPFANPSRLVRIAERNDKLHLPDWTTSVLNYLSWKEKAQCFEQLGAVGFTSFALTGQGDPEQFAGNTITPSLLSLLGLQPVAGREFRDGEDKPGNTHVAMISEALWGRRFSASSAILGQSISLNGEPYTLVGVVPSAISVISNGDIYTPLIIDPPKENRLSHLYTAVARLKQGIATGEAQAQMDSVAAQVGQEHPEVKDWGVRLVEFSDWFVPPQLRTMLLVLMGAVTLVLLIACANVASLLLSRGVSRQQEIAVRSAIGASRADLLRQFLVESLLLAVCGGVLGVLLASAVVRFMGNSLADGVLPIPGIQMNTPVLLFSTVVTLLTSLVFGFAPGWYATRAGLSSLLKQGGRSSTSGHSWIHRSLVAGELALATVLLIGAGLLLQSFLRLQQVRLGFDPSHLITFQLSPPQVRYPNQSASWSFYERLLAALEAQPGILSAAISSGVPFGAGAYTRTPIAPVGPSALSPGQSLPIDWRAVSPDYLQAMKIKLLSGRFFSTQDAANTLSVTVVSQQTASAFWGAENPIGKVIRVAADVLNTSLNQGQIPALYYSAAQRLWPSMDVVLRTQGNPESAIAGARRALYDLDPQLPMAAVKTMDQWIAASAAQPRLNAALVAVFAGSALLLGVIGIYGVLSFSVSQRTREMGVRVALGAGEARVVKLILREGMAVAAAGILAGAAGAAALRRILSSLLFEVGAHDPAAFLTATATLVFAAAVACYLPARRASRIDPIEALRE